MASASSSSLHNWILKGLIDMGNARPNMKACHSDPNGVVFTSTQTSMLWLYRTMNGDSLQRTIQWSSDTLCRAWDYSKLLRLALYQNQNKNDEPMNDEYRKYCMEIVQLYHHLHQAGVGLQCMIDTYKSETKPKPTSALESLTMGNRVELEHLKKVISDIPDIYRAIENSTGGSGGNIGMNVGSCSNAVKQSEP